MTSPNDPDQTTPHDAAAVAAKVISSPVRQEDEHSAASEQPPSDQFQQLARAVELLTQRVRKLERSLAARQTTSR